MTKLTKRDFLAGSAALAGGALAMYVIFYGADGHGYFTITGALFN